MTFTAGSKRLLTTLAVLAALSTGARAQPVDNDYYDPKNATLLKMVEDWHLKPGQIAIAERFYIHGYNDYMFILRYFPNHPQTLILIVQLCAVWKSSQCDYLDPIFERAIARKPDAPLTYVAKGVWLQRGKKYSDAIAAYQTALELDPKSINAHYNLGLAYFETRQFGLANEHAQQAYALGAPLPGLRDKLEKIGQWKPLPAPSGTSAELAPPRAGRDAGAQSSPSSAVPQ